MAGISNNLPVGTKLRDVTVSDSTDVFCHGVYVGSAGDVALMAWDDTAAVTLPAVPAGTFIPIACKRIMSTGTTVSTPNTNIKAIFV